MPRKRKKIVEVLENSTPLPITHPAVDVHTRFEVSIPKVLPMIVLASGRDDAIRQYNKYWGIIGTDHSYTVHTVEQIVEGS